MIQNATYTGASRKTYRWVYVVLGNLMMMCLGTVYAWSVFRIPVEQAFGVGTTLSGLPYMVSLAFYALFMLISGRYLNRFSPRLIMTAGALLISAGWIGSAYAPNIYWLTLTYGAVSGAGVGIAYGVPMAVAAKWFPDKKGLAVGMVLVGFGLSPLVTAPLARHFIEIYGGMQTFKILGAAFGMIIPILALPLTYPSENYSSDHKTGQGQRLASEADTVNGESHKGQMEYPSVVMMKTKSFKILYITFFIGAMIGLMLIGMTGKVAVEWVGLSQGSAALLMSVFAVFNGLGRPVFGWLTDRLSFKSAALISFVSIVVGSLIMIYTKGSSPIAFGLAFSIFWFNLGGWLAIAPASTLSMFGMLNYSQNYGVVFTAYGIGAVAGVISSGVLIDWFGGYTMIFYLVLTLAVVGSLAVKLPGVRQ
ncbi:L-lactate MFS transporter [Acidaminobacter hydrogenoformans]|uniref:Nitrate/nitrite transporter NarK n=1 Tax=Acidaminobacter hydrogenoformans DSM 2784 TaxID=1120920 RepID=A0A1G5S2Z1_9FIRM|nr:OFA family MFS transporter [Acidaminobacter hydrogenoformans]SCZ80121.1 Nitrate/nitrite transporter NarK [Acidaminobacter hydrogenoformans DSM 2784]